MYEDSTAINMNSDPANRNSRPSATLALEVKTNKTDPSSTVSKQANRNGKKRENGNAQWNVAGGGIPMLGPVSSGSKNQKLWQPKPRNLDKRQRGQQGRGAQCGTGNGTQRKNDYQVMDSTDPDLDSLIPETGRKQNLAHLLNMKFQLAPRDCSTSYWRATHSDGNGKGRRYHGYHVGRSHYNKDSYLQANCQFVVKADGDYSVYMTDPDVLVQWELIEQIRIWGPEVGACPICLHPPVAARMSRCGHIYCWPCVLHFLALSDKPSRPCPICDAPIKMQDLKSVVALEHRQLKAGEVVEMRLMKRERHSLQPQPVQRSQSASTVSPAQPPSLQECGGNHVYSKLLLATPRDVVDLILSLEKKDLLDQWEKEKDCPESCFIQQALELLAMRESSAVSDPEGTDVATSDLKSEYSEVETATVVAMESVEDETLTEDTELLDVIADLDSISMSDCSRSRYTSMSSEGHFDHHLSDDVERVSGSPPVRSTHHASQQKNVFYFYQSSEGQAMYLHPLNVQMLVRQYGSLEHCPEVIHGLIVEKDAMSMTEELRNRMRYLGHLPITSQFEIVEIALEEPIIDQETIDEFRERIDERERRRRRKDREERRRDIEIQRAEEAKWGRSKSQPIVRLDSEIHFPGFSPTSTDWDPLLPSQEDGSPPPSGEEIPAHVTQPSPSAASGPSFAQMLRQGKSKPPAWPTVSSASKQSNKLAWERPVSRVRTDSDNDPDGLDYAPAPEFRETFTSALSAAFDKAAKNIAEASLNAATSAEDNRSGRKGKKKAKQKVLFATGMNFM